MPELDLGAYNRIPKVVSRQISWVIARHINWVPCRKHSYVASSIFGRSTLFQSTHNHAFDETRSKFVLQTSYRQSTSSTVAG